SLSDSFLEVPPALRAFPRPELGRVRAGQGKSDRFTGRFRARFGRRPDGVRAHADRPTSAVQVGCEKCQKKAAHEGNCSVSAPFYAESARSQLRSWPESRLNVT